MKGMNEMKKITIILISLMLIFTGCTAKEEIPNKNIQQVINLYYPNIDDENYYYKTVELNAKTQDEVLPSIVTAYKENDVTGTERVLTENTNINSVKLEKKILYLDFNQEFLNDMNAGSSYEELILHSIANTFCEYYGAEKLAITVDNKPYESGHIELEKGEYITPDYSKSVCINKVC